MTGEHTPAPLAPHEAAPVHPLAAVCGVAGGAGTSSVAYLLARHTAERASSHVLALDTGGPHASLALLAGIEGPRTLAAASDSVATGALNGELFATQGRLRMIARRPGSDPNPDIAGVERIVADAREVHALTVCDCGTLQRGVERRIAELASAHVWVTPATDVGAVFARDRVPAVALAPPERSVLVACARHESQRSPKRAFMRTADRLGMRLVFVPPLGDPYRNAAAALSLAEGALEAIEGAITR